MTRIIFEDVKMNSTFQMLEGMRILLKYEPRCLINVVEDKLYFGYTYSEIMIITEEDRTLLEELDWFFDDEMNSWAKYVE